MARWGGLVALLVAAIAFSGLATGYGERVFNANEQSSGGSYPIDETGFIITLPERAAQSFTPVVPFVLLNVTSYVENVGGQADSLNVTVQGDAAGSPDETPVAWSQRGRSGTGWLDLPLTPAPTLNANVKYWIVARNSQSAGNGYRWFHANGNVVPGEAKTNGGSGWSAPDATDMTFVAYGLRLEPQITVGLSVDRRSAAPGESFAYTVYVNNTGSRDAPTAWVNVTLAPLALYEDDTATSIGGVRTPPTSWRISQLPNGPHSFTINASVDPVATGGTPLDAIVHLDYADSAGIPQPSSSALASLLVALKTKPLYLTHDQSIDLVDGLRATAPTGTILQDFDGDGNPGATIGGSALSWTLTPVLARPFHVRGALSAEVFLNANNPNDSGTFNVTLFDRRGVVSTPFAWVETTVQVDGDPSLFEVFTLDLGVANHYLLQGNVTELRIVKVMNADLHLAYNTTDVPSRIVLPTSTFISIDDVSVLDDQRPATIFSAKDNVNIHVNVSDPLGSGEIAGVTIDVTDPDGTALTAGAPLTRIATDPSSPSAWSRFAYVLPFPIEQGAYAFRLTAREGNGVESVASGGFTVRYPSVSFSVSQDIQSARRNALVRFSLSFDNDGQGSGPVWVNGTLPPELEFVSDTSSSIGGTKAGTFRWSFADVMPGPHEFDLAVRVVDTARNGTISAQFDLTYGDEKDFLWFAATVVRDLDVIVPTTPATPSNPFLLAVLGAMVVGAPLAGYWVWRSRRPAIEEAFLIHRDGVLLYHLSRSIGGEGEKDRDILGAMLTAVQDFVKDSFRYGENRDLSKLEFGDHRVLIERGKHIFLAVVMSSTTGEPEVRRKVRKVIDDVEAKFGANLEDFSGEMDPILGIRDLVKQLVGRT